MNTPKKTKKVAYLLREVFLRLPAKLKRQFGLILAYTVFSSIVATVAAVSIALFAAAFSSQENIPGIKYVMAVQESLNIELFNGPRGGMIILSLLMVTLTGIKNVLDSLLYYLTARYGASVETYFGMTLFRGFIHMPYQWHLNRNSADIILALEWRGYIGQSLFNAALKTMNDVFLVFFLLLAVFVANPYLSIIIFLMAGLIGSVIYCKIHHVQDRQAQRSKEYNISIYRQLMKGIQGIKDVKVSGKISFLLDFERDAYQASYIQGMKSFFVKIPTGLLETVGCLLLAVSVVFMLYFTKSSLAEITTLISLLVVAAWRVLPAINRIMSGFLTIRGLLPYIDAEIDYMNDIQANAVYPPEMDSSSTSITFQNEIQINDVGFVYQNRDKCVLENIHFHIKKGQTVGIVGRSGEGKSTLVDILIGLLEPTKGQIVIDGNILDGTNKFAWMKKLSYVSQSPYIFDGTVAENIAYGLRTSEIDRDLVWECCRMAYIKDIVEELPQGIDTLIGERGVRLSGGQRQRVAIARALYTRPELMIFDEATSSLDTKSENAIHETIAGLKGTKTLIIVAHRLKTVEGCDMLVWLKDGRVQRMGPPRNVLLEYEESLK